MNVIVRNVDDRRLVLRLEHVTEHVCTTDAGASIAMRSTDVRAGQNEVARGGTRPPGTPSGSMRRRKPVAATALRTGDKGRTGKECGYAHVMLLESSSRCPGA